MRWEQLFADLDAQWEADERRERDAEVAERTRGERAGIGLLDRLLAHTGEPLAVDVVTGTRVEGRLADAGADWLLLRVANPPKEVLVPLAAVVGVLGLPPRAALGQATARRFRLGYVLRGLSRDRTTVVVLDASGRSSTGTIDRVGVDAIDISEHAVEEPRRPGQVIGRRTVPFAAVVSVESR